MGAGLEEIERIFKLWLELSDDQDIFCLLELVERTLRQRGYTVRIEVQPPPGQAE